MNPYYNPQMALNAQLLAAGALAPPQMGVPPGYAAAYNPYLASQVRGRFPRGAPCLAVCGCACCPPFSLTRLLYFFLPFLCVCVCVLGVMLVLF